MIFDFETGWRHNKSGLPLRSVVSTSHAELACWMVTACFWKHEWGDHFISFKWWGLDELVVPGFGRNGDYFLLLVHNFSTADHLLNYGLLFYSTQKFLESLLKPRHLLGINQLDWLFLNTYRGNSSVFDHSLSLQTGRTKASSRRL
jgi:hypothetical protein